MPVLISFVTARDVLCSLPSENCYNMADNIGILCLLLRAGAVTDDLFRLLPGFAHYLGTNMNTEREQSMLDYLPSNSLISNHIFRHT